MILLVFSSGLVVAGIRDSRILTRERAVREIPLEDELPFRNAFQEALPLGWSYWILPGAYNRLIKGSRKSLSIPLEEVFGKPLIVLAATEDHAQIVRDRNRLIAGEVRSYRAERRFIRKDGVPVWVRTSVSHLRSNGEQHTIALVEDITEQKQAREKLKNQAMRDLLTGLPNRRHFEEALEAAIRLSKEALVQQSAEVALLYLDLDGFKLVNDTLGHRVGDLLLKEVGARVRERLQDSDLLARVGGDEFSIVLTGMDGPKAPACVAQRLLKAFNSPFQIESREINIGASIGISRYPLDGDDSITLVQSADAAMYCAKRSGAGRYQFFTPQMKQDAHQRLMIESRLQRALDHHELSVQFQPQYELASNTLVRFEALCRWFNPELGQVPPDRFIPVAEKTGLIAEIGKFVLREACRQALQWQGGRLPVQVAVNVSAVQFARADFVNSVIDILHETGLGPALLELELTESSLIQDREDAVRKMHFLKTLGVRMSIDDFGTGYSSLSYLQNMPVDALKVDRSFTGKLGSSQTALSMVRAMIAMARALGIRVVTEGVENSAQVEILRQLGCDEVQGYYFGRPEDGKASVERVFREMMPVDSALVLEVNARSKRTLK